MKRTRMGIMLGMLVVAVTALGCDGDVETAEMGGVGSAAGMNAVGAAEGEDMYALAPTAEAWSEEEGSGEYGEEQPAYNAPQAPENDEWGDEGGNEEGGDDFEEDPQEEVEGEPEKETPPATNPYVLADAQPLSTFASDSDTASYDIFLQHTNSGDVPPADKVRLEEFINSFDYEYEAPAPDADVPFSVSMDIAPSPFTEGADILRIGVQGNTPVNDFQGSNLVFLVDVSGSMSSAAKLPLVKLMLTEAVAQLGENDRVAIVTYASGVGVHLPSTAAAQADTIVDAIDSLQAGGSTAGAAGIDLAYSQASAGFIEEGINHIVLCTDGDFNVGPYSNSELLELIEEKRKTGITLTVLGFGYGSNDSMMELVSNAGNGVYGVIIDEDDAIHYAATDLLDTLNFIAKDVKIQVELNSDYVYAYRQLGYENRQLEDWMFYADAIDAGEIPAGHSVTALYEIIRVGMSIPEPEGAPEVLAQSTESDIALEAQNDEMAVVKIRYKDRNDDAEDPSMQVNTVLVAENEVGAFEDAHPDLRFAAALAAFAEVLKESPFARPDQLDLMREILADTQGTNPLRGQLVGAVDTALPLLSE